MQFKFLCIVLVSSLFLLMQSGLRAENSNLRDQIESFYNARRQALFEQERMLYENSEPKNGLYHIYVFGQVVPIPNRFVLLTQELSEHQFNSMQLTSDVSIEGVIKVGDYKAIKSMLKNKNDPIKDDYIDSRTGFNIRVYEQKITSATIGKEISMEEVIISNGEQYLSVFDDNPDLWKLILSQLE